MNKGTRSRAITHVRSCVFLFLGAVLLCTGYQGAQAQGGPCGCIDIVFVQDTTGSMGPAINNVKAGLSDIINAAITASGGDVRLGVVTFTGFPGEGVIVNQPFTTDTNAVKATIDALVANGGAGEPESSDEALKYVVTGATGCTLTNPLGDLGPFRPECVKIAILDTDARPGGCDDTYTTGVDDVNAAAVATAAAAAGIKISAVYNETYPYLSPTIIPIMQNYAATTGGEYVQTPSDGSGTGAAIADIIAECGGVWVLSLTPQVATNYVGQTHIATTCVTSNGVPVANISVAVSVTGTNGGVSGTCITDASGCCSLSYVGANEGDDLIKAESILAGRTNVAFAIKTWIPMPCEVTITCPSNIVATNDPGQCSAVVNYVVSASSDCGIASLTVEPPSGSVFPNGTTTVTATALDTASNSNSCSFTVTVVDGEAPRVACRPAPNPSGKKIPVSGKNPPSGQNPDGYYQLLARDNCDPDPAIYVQDTGSAFRAGPFANGAIVKIRQNPGGTPSSTPGTPPITADIHLKGDGLAIAVDADGNETSAENGCLMLIPPDPK